MRLSTANEVWRLIAGDWSKYAIDAAKLEIENGRGTLIVTNGMALVVLPVELDEGDEAGLIPGDALGGPTNRPAGISRHARDDENDEDDEDDVQPAFIRLRVSDGRATIERHATASKEFPDWRKVLPAADAPCAVEFRVSAKLLYDLARAAGCGMAGQLTLRVPAPRDGCVRDPIRIDVPDSGGIFGAVMPVLPLPGTKIFTRR